MTQKEIAERWIYRELSIDDLVYEYQCTRSAAYQVMSRLVRKGLFKRIDFGVYENTRRKRK